MNVVAVRSWSGQPPRPSRARFASSGPRPGGVRRGSRRRRPGGWIRITRSSLGTGLPPALFTVPIQSSPSGARVAADSRPYTPLIRISGAPVKVPLPSGPQHEQRRGPGLGDHHQPRLGHAARRRPAGWARSRRAAAAVRGTTRCSTSWGPARSVTQLIARVRVGAHPARRAQPRAEHRRGRVGVAAGRAAEGVDAQQLAGQRPEARIRAPPASPVATSSDPSTSTPSAPPLFVGPRGIPTSTGSGGSPVAMRTTRLSVGGAHVGVDQLVLGVAGGEHQAGQPAAPARVGGHGRDQHRVGAALHAQHPAGGPLGHQRGPRRPAARRSR